MCVKGKDINPKLSMTNRIAVMQVKKSKASTAQWHNSQKNCEEIRNRIQNPLPQKS